MAARILIIEDNPANMELMAYLLTAFGLPSAPGAAAPVAQTLLIVDDDAFMLDVLADFLGEEGYTILTAQTAAEGIALLAHHDVQVVVCDQCMPLMSGTEFLERTRQLRPDCYRIMLTALTDFAPITEAVERGDIDRYFTKPWDGAELRASLREGFRVHALRAAALEPDL